MDSLGGFYAAVDAFVACGGSADKEGHVKRETLIKIIKHDFGLTIDIEVYRKHYVTEDGI